LSQYTKFEAENVQFWENLWAKLKGPATGRTDSGFIKTVKYTIFEISGIKKKAWETKKMKPFRYRLLVTDINLVLPERQIVQILSAEEPTIRGSTWRMVESGQRCANPGILGPSPQT